MVTNLTHSIIGSPLPLPCSTKDGVVVAVANIGDDPATLVEAGAPPAVRRWADVAAREWAMRDDLDAVVVGRHGLFKPRPTVLGGDRGAVLVAVGAFGHVTCS